MRWVRSVAVAAAVLAVGVPLGASRFAAGRTRVPAPSPSPSASSSLVVTFESQPPIVPEPDPAAAARLLALTNAERAKRGLRALRPWPSLVPIARAHTIEMLDAGRLYHNKALTTLVRQLRLKALGENVGVGPTIDTVEAAFMRSAEHRANILDASYRYVGIWAMRDERGFVWVTVNFGAP
jgi:uncharacterized protein YkwD